MMPEIYIFCSPARSPLQQSSSSGDLLPEMMESETPPPVSSPNRADDFEVSSRRVSPNQQVVRGMAKTQPEGNTSVAQSPGADNKGQEMSGLRPETITGTNKRIPSKGGRTPTAASGDPEAPDVLTNMLQKAFVSEEHRTLMGTVVERVLSARSGLNEAFVSLLKGFEVCNVIFLIVLGSHTSPVYR